MREVYKKLVLIIPNLQYTFIASISTQKFWISSSSRSLKEEKKECTGDICYLCKEIKQSVAVQNAIKYTLGKSASYYWREIHADLKATYHFKGLDPSWGLMS